MLGPVLTAAIWCGTFVVAAPSSSSVVHESRSHVIPTGWVDTGRIHPETRLPLRIALVQPIHNIDAILDDISHPASQNYGKHWTAAQVKAKFSPSREALSSVREWLLDHFDSEKIQLTSSGSWYTVNASVKEAEILLKTQYKLYSHETNGINHMACHKYHIPKHLTSHIDLITPTVHFNVPTDKIERRQSDEVPARRIGQPISGLFSPPMTDGVPLTQFPTELSSCDSQTTLDCLRALYNISYTFKSPSNNSFAIVEYTPQAYTASDLQAFFAQYSPDLVGQTPNLTSINGGTVQNQTVGFGFNGESNLDLTYGMGLVGANQPVTLYQVGDMTQGASFNDFLDALDGTYCTFEGGDDPTQDAMYPDANLADPDAYRGYKNCGTVKAANVISTSYAYNEADLTPSYIRRQCTEYAKLGMMGVTVLYSSGDFGVAGNQGNCIGANGMLSPKGTRFNPSFPGTCPYITSIGATQVNPNNTVSDPESACEQVIYSGGGFSNVFPLPDFQKDAVTSYLDKYKPSYSAEQYNNSGQVRGFPDISANGANYIVPVGGAFVKIYGTSASTPVIGAMLTMINDARISAGKSTIGFINPALYSEDFSEAYNDITTGANQGCGTPGFSATPGWDPVTGLGTPKFPVLLDKFLSLP